MEIQPTGSPFSGEPEFLAVGRLRRPFGLRGEIFMEVLTDFPERLKPGSRVFVGPHHAPIHIRSCRWHRNRLLIAFDGYAKREEIAELRNQNVTVLTSERPELPEGEFYHHQIIGLRVVTQDGEALGSVAEILETGANDVYIVRNQTGEEILLPAIDSVIVNVDLEGNEILVDLIPGLR
jgi:16S rRNA processing protein RimM